MTEYEVPLPFVPSPPRHVSGRPSSPDEVQKVEQQYREMVDRAPIGVYQSTTDGRLLTVNPALARLLGYEHVSELLEQNLRDVYVNPRERELLVVAFEQVGTSAEVELQWKCKDGSPIWLQVNAHTVLHLEDGSRRFEGFVRDITQRKLVEQEREQADQELRTQREQLWGLSQRLLEVQETERRYLARELHDELGQLLTAAKLTLQAVARARSVATTRTMVKDAVGLLDQCLRQVRSLSLELRPSLLDDLGLAAALRWYVDRQAERAGFSAHLVDELGDRRLPTEIETTCFRVAQEALTNVARHASATEVHVTLTQQDGHLDLLVRDNGSGFQFDQARARAVAGGSLGLLGMEERVSLAGGQLSVISQPGRGTEVHVTLPIDARVTPANPE